VAPVGIGRADNAALLAVHILALGEPSLAERLAAYRRAMRDRVLAADSRLLSSP
jgi:phosphoribosylcarboxyaminoimidazole (NCAIR) mutase